MVFLDTRHQTLSWQGFQDFAPTKKGLQPEPFISKFLF
jgi:hypothetical protein